MNDEGDPLGAYRSASTFVCWRAGEADSEWVKLEPWWSLIPQRRCWSWRQSMREWVREAVVNKYVRSELLINRLWWINDEGDPLSGYRSASTFVCRRAGEAHSDCLKNTSWFQNSQNWCWAEAWTCRVNLSGKVLYLCIFFSLSLNISGHVNGKLFFGSVILRSW